MKHVPVFDVYRLNFCLFRCAHARCLFVCARVRVCVCVRACARARARVFVCILQCLLRAWNEIIMVLNYIWTKFCFLDHLSNAPSIGKSWEKTVNKDKAIILPCILRWQKRAWQLAYNDRVKVGSFDFWLVVCLVCRNCHSSRQIWNNTERFLHELGKTLFSLIWTFYRRRDRYKIVKDKSGASACMLNIVLLKIYKGFPLCIHFFYMIWFLNNLISFSF